VKFLRSIGAWDKVEHGRTQEYHGMEVWDGISGAKISFDPIDSQRRGLGSGVLDAVGEMIPGSQFSRQNRHHGDATAPSASTIATMCENQNLTTALLGRLRASEDVEILDQIKVESITLGPESEDEKAPDLSQWPILTLADSRQLAAKLLVGADGAHSPVRNFADIQSEGWDYDQHGIVATLDVDRTFSEDELRTAYQRFLPTGPIALLPLPGNKASLVWSMSTPLATKLKALSPPSFAEMVTAAFRLRQVDLAYLLNHGTSDQVNIADEVSWRLPNTPPAATGLPPAFPHIDSSQEGSIASFPLRMRHASTYTGHRVALIGDAAHTVHPLAGQGLNLGLADAEALANRIINGVEHGMDIGTSWCLDEYNSQRWAKNNAVMGVCDKLQKLYGVESGPVVWARSLGLNLVNSLGGLKGSIMRAAGT